MACGLTAAKLKDTRVIMGLGAIVLLLSVFTATMIAVDLGVGGGSELSSLGENGRMINLTSGYRPDSLARLGPNSADVMVSSLYTGGIRRVNLNNGEQTQVVPEFGFADDAPEGPFVRGAGGVAVTDDMVLVAGLGPHRQPGMESRLYFYDMDTGDEVISCGAIDTGHPRTLNDVAADEEYAYVSDSTYNAIFRVGLARIREGFCDTSDIPLPAAEWRAPIGSNVHYMSGIQLYRDGLVIANSDLGGLYFVNLQDNAVKRLDRGPGEEARGVDGIAINGQTVYATEPNEDRVSVWSFGDNAGKKGDHPLPGKKGSKGDDDVGGKEGKEPPPPKGPKGETAPEGADPPPPKDGKEPPPPKDGKEPPPPKDCPPPPPPPKGPKGETAPKDGTEDLPVSVSKDGKEAPPPPKDGKCKQGAEDEDEGSSSLSLKLLGYIRSELLDGPTSTIVVGDAMYSVNGRTRSLPSEEYEYEIAEGEFKPAESFSVVGVSVDLEALAEQNGGGQGDGQGDSQGDNQGDNQGDTQGDNQGET